MNEKKTRVFFFSLPTEEGVLRLTHSGSIKFAVKQITKHVYAISNHEIIPGHAPMAYSVILSHESILTCKLSSLSQTLIVPKLQMD